MNNEMRLVHSIYNKEDISAQVSYEYYKDPVARFIKFCINGEEGLENTRVVLISLFIDEESKAGSSNFLAGLIEEIKGDNDVVFILKVNKEDEDQVIKSFSASNYSAFRHYYFGNCIKDADSHSYFVNDHACVEAHHFINEMFTRLERSKEVWN